MKRRSFWARPPARKLKKGGFWGKKTKQKPRVVKKPNYRVQYVVEKTTDNGRTRPIKTLNDPEAAKNFIARQKYRYPDAEFKKRPEKIRKFW